LFIVLCFQQIVVSLLLHTGDFILIISSIKNLTTPGIYYFCSCQFKHSTMDDITFQENNEKFKECSFCKVPRESVWTVIIGKEACICPNCSVGAHKLLVEKTSLRPNLTVLNEKEALKPVKSIVFVIVTTIILMLALFFIYKK
jgi:hypothetical protein